MTERWNLSQAEAWVAYRSLAKVDEYEVEGFAGFAFDGAYGGGAKRIVEQPRAAILAALRQGKLTACGIAAGEPRTSKISAVDWAHLWLANRSKADGGGVVWTCISFDPAKVMDLWPEAGPELAEERAAAELHRFIKQGGPRMKKADFADHLASVGVGITKRAIDRVWRTVTKGTAWAGPGRPKKITAANRRTPPK